MRKAKETADAKRFTDGDMSRGRGSFHERLRTRRVGPGCVAAVINDTADAKRYPAAREIRI